MATVVVVHREVVGELGGLLGGNWEFAGGVAQGAEPDGVDRALSLIRDPEFELDVRAVTMALTARARKWFWNSGP